MSLLLNKIEWPGVGCEVLRRQQIVLVTFSVRTSARLRTDRPTRVHCLAVALTDHGQTKMTPFVKTPSCLLRPTFAGAHLWHSASHSASKRAMEGSAITQSSLSAACPARRRSQTRRRPRAEPPWGGACIPPARDSREPQTPAVITGTLIRPR
jgi:hypothetical protein